MSSIRKCTKCGQQISLRKMPHGKWVAFDSSTQIAHKCHKKNNPDAKIKDLAKNKIIKEANDESISIKYEDEPSSANISEYIEEVTEEPRKVKKEIKENINVNEDSTQSMSAEELIKDYKSDNEVREERHTSPAQNEDGGSFFKLILYAGGFFLVMFLLAKAPGAAVGLIFFIIFMFFIFKR
jgi:Flp pilus assembly protein TadB